jgi:formylglycine-generating enzyme required for sulfatase activity
MDYLDFDLTITISAGGGSAYPVEARSPAGEATATLHWTLSGLALENRLKDLQIALLSSGGGRRALSSEEATVQQFGGELFDALISGEIRSRYDVIQTQARQGGKGVRLRLRIDPPALASLPWEFLYDRRGGEYVCLSRQTPIVRYLDLPQPVGALPVQPPLRILGLIASPGDLPPLDVTVERERIDRAVQPLQGRGLLELTWLEGQSWRELRRAMTQGPWHIFHFVGHGDYDPGRDEGQIALTGENGKAHFFSARELARLLADHDALRLVLLNACKGAAGGGQDRFASTAATLVRRGIPAVIAMQYPITDYAAIEFAQSFYERLVAGLPIDTAVTEARKAISFAIANTVEWGTPVLFLRAQDGRIFDLPATAAPLPKVLERTSPMPARSLPPPKRSTQPWRLIVGVLGLVALLVAAVVFWRGQQLAQLLNLVGGLLVIAPTEGQRLAGVNLTPGPTATQTATPQPATPTAATVAAAALMTETATSTVRETPTLAPTATDTPDLGATATAQHQAIATIVVATLTAAAPLPTPTPTASPTRRPTNTPTPTPLATPTPAAGERRVVTVDGVEFAFVYVPAGTFMMGSPAGVGYDDERPAHEVTLAAYWIGQTEVTNAQYRRFVAAGGYTQETLWTPAGCQWRRENNITEPLYWDDTQWNGDNYPVVGVSWYEASAFATWLSQETGLTVRLPSEAEWERAARGEDGRTYPWGDESPSAQLLNYNGNLGRTSAVGSYPDGVSPYGALDMAGNVWEWVDDWYNGGYYCVSPGENPLGPTSGTARVVRGGSWTSSSKACAPPTGSGTTLKDGTTIWVSGSWSPPALDL